MEDNTFVYCDKQNNEMRAVPIENGLKIDVRDIIYNELKNNKIITDNFLLNVKRLNRWWYNIYFKSKESN